MVHLYLNGDGVQDLGELEGRIGEVERGDGLFGEDDGGDEQELDISFGESESDSESESGEADQKKDAKLGQSGNEDTNSDKLLGGATSFTDRYKSKDAVCIFPKASSVLIFQQRNLVHDSDDVFQGVKYTMQADVMYEQVCDDNE